MAKNVKGGTVEVTVSDKGSLKKLGKDARRTGKDMGSVAKSTAESDRRLKSLSNQTSNSSKAFSKQAQTIQGGLVPVYATLAAQVFAVSAAFRFLQDSVNFRNLVAGQAAYGAATGSMFSVVSKSVRDASNSLISYQDASQAVAIGTAAGLNASQMERLGKAASDVSLALGRDVVDSFNRLVRGVTKAEPELLDELGIILRLDPALKQYAATLGKSKEDLNQFERAQAVTNFVLDQAESKFGRMNDLIPSSAFALGQFQQAFNDMLNDLQVGLAGIVDFVAPFFTQNIQAFAAALLVFVVGIVKTMLPNFDMIAAQGAKTVTSLKAQIKEMQAELQILGKTRTIKTPAGAERLRREGLAEVQSIDPSVGSLSQQQISARLSRLQSGKQLRDLKDMTDDKVLIYQSGLEKMQAANKFHKGKEAIDVETAETAKQLSQKKTTLKHEQELLKQEQRQRRNAKFMIAAFKAIYIAGFAVMIFQATKALVNFLRFSAEERKEQQKRAKHATDLADRLSDVNDNLERMIELRKRLMVDSPTTQFAKALQTQDINKQLDDIAKLDKALLEFGQWRMDEGFVDEQGSHWTHPKIMFMDFIYRQFDSRVKPGEAAALSMIDMIDNLEKLIEMSPNPEMTDTLEKMKLELLTTNEVTPKTRAKFIELQQQLISTENSASQFNQTILDLQKGLVGLAESFAPKTSFINIQGLVDSNVKAMADASGILRSDIKRFAEDAGFAGIIDFERALQDASRTAFDPNKGGLQLIPTVGERYLEDVLGINDPKTLKQLTERINDIVNQNELIAELQPILDTNLVKERAINEELAKNKTTRASIIQDSSLAAVQATYIANAEERRLNISKSLTIEEGLQRLLESEKINIIDGLEDALRHALNLQRQTTKELQLQNFMLEHGEEIRRRGLQNALKTRQDTIAPFSMAHMFGMTKPITEDNIAGTIRKYEEDTGLEMTREEAIQNLQRFNAQLSFTEMQMNLINNLSTSIGTALVDGLANAFVEVAKGTMTFADAFRNMTIEILAQIAAMTMKMAIFKALAGFFVFTPSATGQGFDADFNTISGSGSALQGKIDTIVAGKTGVRYGGIMSSPGYRSFGRGGIATGPDSGYAATLHGTEAVVPLGNDRSIPVELKGAGGGINNITVNVNGGTTGGGQSPEQAKALGNMIQVATMEIIQREKRPGGVLSR